MTPLNADIVNAIPSEFSHRAVAHFAKALRKHPRFADALFPSTDVAEAGQSLQEARDLVAHFVTNGGVDGVMLAQCEIAESQFANAMHQKAACVDELYDAVAVLMRMIAVVEGKQELGGEK